MDASAGETLETEQQSSFGIKKIVDCKIGEGGRQMYKVKWEPTWEPAENLASCQHLIDEFWSFVNKAKTNEEVAQQHRKRMRLDSGNNVINIDENFDRMSEDNKADVQRLIARANVTSVGNNMLVSPSNMLMSPQRNQQNNMMAMAGTPTHSNNQNFPNSPQTPQNMRQQNPGMAMMSPGQKSLNFGSPQQNMPSGQQNFSSPGQKGKFGSFGNKGNAATPTKAEPDETWEKEKHEATGGNKDFSSTSGLKYIEAFSNPYVKIILVCKVCNKEQLSKSSSNWKKHYLTHSAEKPHKCQYCEKTFVQTNNLKAHMKKHIKEQQQVKKEELIESEPYFNFNQFQ